MRVKATIQVNGRPLRWAYVEHLVFGAGSAMYITDSDGKIRDIDFNEGVDNLTDGVDIRIICQNPVLRVIDGDNANIGVYQDKHITNGATVNLDSNAEQDDYYAILNRAQIAYQIVFQPLKFFQDLDRPEFPLGRLSSLRETRDQPKRIELVYPDHSVAQLAWVEPNRLIDNFPLMHIKHRTEDDRLFGTNEDSDGERGDPILIPHELAHALHFSFLSKNQRVIAETKYGEFMLGSVLGGSMPFHDTDVVTTPEVAYIEAGGWFSHLFMEFMRARQGGGSTLVRPEPITDAIRSEFLSSEWLRVTKPHWILAVLENLPRLNIAGLFRSPSSGTGGGVTRPASRSLFYRLGREPTVTGGDVEGAIYGAIFVDFAQLVSLDFAASSYFAANALNFGQYRNFIRERHREHADKLEQVIRFWGL